MQKRAQELGRKCTDFCKLFYDLGGLSDEGDDREIHATYHDSCHLKRSLGVTEEQRELLKHTKGVTLTEMDEHDVCCGFAGSYSISYPEISSHILQRKLENIKASGADCVVMDCPGCMMQIKGGLDAHGIEGIDVKHTAQLLAEKRGLM